MIKALIFDCFGVLTVDGWLKFCDANFIDGPKRTQAHKLNEAVDKGQINYREFLNSVADLAGVDYGVAEETIMEPQPKNTALLELIKELKSIYKTAILSNIANPGWFSEYFSAEELALFDEIVASSSLGVIKPDPEIFEYAAKKLNLALSECLFIDDRIRNVEAAKELGMPALLYENLPKFKKDLAAITDN